MDDVSDIAAYYNQNAEQERSRLERHQLEYDLTWRYLEQYLPACAKILEIGAATGRYTLALARRGCRLTAVDMSSTPLEVLRASLAAQGLEDQVRLLLADARDLSALTEKDFDAVLLMGPLYHLIHEADRQQAVRQAADHLRHGGLLFSAFISRMGIFGDLLRKMPDWIEKRDEVRGILEQGKNPDNDRNGAFRGYFARVSEVAPLHEALGFESIVVAGVEPAISADDESYNRLQGQQRQQWLDLFYQISADPSITGASRHLLYIGRKA